MKIAIFLTGLIIDKKDTLVHIKRMFDYWSEKNNIKIDVYAHFWDSIGLYPYTINYDDTMIKVPWENKGSVDYAIDLFKPVSYKISKYTDLHDYFIKFLYDNKHYTNDPWIKEIHSSVLTARFFNKDIHKRFFVDNFDRPEYQFDLWWSYHVKWCQFVHVASQAYTAAQSLKMIIESGNTYDAVLKWRFDLICDYKTHNNRLVEVMKTPFASPTYTSDIAWQGLMWEKDLHYDNSKDYSNEVVSVADSWFILNWSAASILANNLIDYYVKCMGETFSGIPGGQHTYFHDTVRQSNVKINLIGRIHENLIRFPDTIPFNYHDNPAEHFNLIYAKNFRAKRNSDFKNMLEHWDRRSQYYTVSKFSFY